MSSIKDFFSKESTKRILFFIALIIFFYWSRSFFDIFLLTFLFSYIMNSLQNLLLRKVHKVTSAKEKLTTSILYILLFLSIGIIIVKIVPQIVSQTKYIINNISSSISNTKTKDYFNKRIKKAFTKVLDRNTIEGIHENVNIPEFKMSSSVNYKDYKSIIKRTTFPVKVNKQIEKLLYMKDKIMNNYHIELNFRRE